MRVAPVLFVSYLGSALLGATIVACSSSSSSKGSTSGASSAESQGPCGAFPCASGGKSSSSSKSSASGGGDGGSSAAIAAACASAAAAECALQAKCNPQQQTEQYGDGGTCVARETTACLEGYAAPGNGDTVAHTTACATAEATETCAEDLNLTPPTACTQVTGTGANGSMCNHPGQCQSGYCAIPTQSACGECATQPTAGVTCADFTTCGQGLACFKGTCITPTTTMGGPCGATQPCGQGLGCVVPVDAGAAGSCQTLGTAVGAACDPTATVGAGCDEDLGLYCISDTKLATYKTCQQALIAGPGMPCDHVKGIETICAQGTCVKPPDAGAACVARAADDAGCNTITGPDCTPPARCVGTQLDGGVSGTCTLAGPSCGGGS